MTATSPLWSSKRGVRYSAVGASDLYGLTPVTPYLNVATTAGRAVIAAATSGVEVAGMVYQDTRAGQGCAVYYDKSSEFRIRLNATCATAGSPIGVVGTTNTIVHPQSGTTGILPLLGPVAGSSGVAVWQIGEAQETGVPGQTISVRVNPRQLSGLV